MENIDVFIVGGGINGTAIAADAAGRGLSVILCEKNDLASGTSSASTKLIHGGLRYLESYELGLVKTALREREVLMQKAPHLIAPLEFILPHEKHLRPMWLIRIGLFLYDHLAKTSLPHSKRIHFKKDARGSSLLTKFKQGFSYYDCWTDDARLTLLNALAAKEHGATILTQHEYISAARENHHWKIQVKQASTQKTFYARVLINAAGPWINQVQATISKKLFNLQLVKGSHIVVPKLFSGEFAYILQNLDKRIIFAIPYQDKFTLIGTTDVACSNDDINHIKISRGEESYLCSIINKYFKKTISPHDIIWSYSGVRCLQGNSTGNLSKLSRDYKLAFDNENNVPLLTVIGGKITTHRRLAEEAVNKLTPLFPAMRPAWTASAPLPGGDFVNHDFQKFYTEFKNNFSWLPEKIAHHYAKNYGTRAYLILDNAHQLADLGKEVVPGLYQKELDYLIQHEWAKTAEDILWRRTKLGLTLSQEEQQKLTDWFRTATLFF